MNCFYTLCGPLPPSFLNLRALIQADSIRYQTDENALFHNRVWDSSVEYPAHQQQRFIPRDYV